MKSIFPILCLWLFIPVLSKAQNNPIFFADTAGHIKCINCIPGDTGSVNGVVYEAVDRNLLNQRRDQGADLTKLCTSLVTDMSWLFSFNHSFNQPIANWDVSHVTSMWHMFRDAYSFNQSIGNWDVSAVTTMEGMFMGAYAFNQSINSWNVSSVTQMGWMFQSAYAFNQPIGNWNVGSVTNMSYMFRYTTFNQPIGNWDVSHVTNISSIFEGAVFNQPIGGWNVSAVTNMAGMFLGNTHFNQAIGNWNVGQVTNMEGMFWNATSFNQPINSWCVTQIPTAPNSFSSNCPLVSGFKPIWGTCTNQAPAQLLFFADTAGHIKCINCIPGDTGTVNGIVYEAVDRNLLNQRRDQGADLTKVCTSLVTDMSNLFNGNQTFNQDISNWDVSSVTSMWNMFCNSTFNQPIGNWDVSHVNNMVAMFFQNSFFNQDISTWNVSAVTNMSFMFFRAQSFNQPIGTWDVSHVTDMNHMFVETYQFNQPIGNWNVGQVTYMYDMFFGSVFNQPIGNWDVSKVTNMYRMFLGDTNFNQAIGNWNVGQVTNMWQMFYGANKFNQNISGWDVHNVVEMSGMFANTTFNQPIGNWNVGSVTNMDGMFAFNHDFNQPLNNWNVSSVTNMSMMFRDAYSFNQPIGNWNVSAVTNMAGMFQGANSFNQAIGNWDVSHVTDMALMFEGSSFNQPIANWNTASLKKMDVMFRYTPFNQPIGNWDVSQVTDMVAVFSYSPFNQPINNWNVSHVTNMSEMFRGNTVFNQSIGNWNMSHVSNMENMFYQANNFNQPIGNWDVSHVTNMGGMFCGAVNFNQNIDNWNVSHVINMGAMFMGNGNSSFNQPLGHWNVSSVTNFTWMFDGAAAFNQPINTWCVAHIPSTPINFSSSCPLQTAYLPQWGTCPTVTPFADTAICLGNSAVMWAPSAPGYLGSPLHYTWSTGDTTLTLAASPLQTTNYACTISDGIQSYSDTIQIRVDTIAQNFIVSDTVFSCSTQVSLAAAAGYDSYFWNTGQTSASLIAQVSGWYSCTVTHGACSAMDAVLYQHADIAQSDTSLCAGEPLNLSINNISDNGLLGYWEFSGNTLNSIPGGLQATFSQVELDSNRQGMSHQALGFHTKNGSMTIPYVNTPEISISMWYQYGGTAGNWNTLACWDGGQYHHIIISPSGELGYYNNGFYGCGFFPQYGQWYHLILIKNGTQSKLYVNDSLVQSTNQSFSNQDFPLRTLGNFTANEIQGALGTIDDIIIFNRALQTSELALLTSQTFSYAHALSHLWSTGDTINHLIVSPTQSQTYYCTVNNGNSSCTDSVTVTVNPLPQNPVAQDTIIACADSVIVTAAAGYSHYQWNTRDTTQNIVAKYTGMYTLHVTNANGCVGVDSVLVSIIDARIQQNDTTVCFGSDVFVSMHGLYTSESIPKTEEYVSNLYFDYDDFEGGSGSSDDWTQRDGTDPQIVSNTAFSGSHSLYFNNGWGRNFEFGVAENTQPIGGFFSAEYPYMSMAYKIPSSSHTSMLVYIAGIGWRGIAFTQGEQLSCYLRVASWNETDTVIKNNQWHFKTINLHEQLQQSLGPGNYKIEAVIFHEACSTYPVSGEMWIDKFMITKNKPSLYPVSYTWNTNDTASSISITPAQTTTYYCTVNNGISSCTDSVTVTVNPLPQNPIVQDTINACADSVIVTATAGYSHYQWSNGDTTQNIFAKYTGMYTLSVTNANGCVGVDSVLVSVINTQIQQNDTSVCSGNGLTLVLTNTIPTNLRNGLLGYWPFNANTNDESGHNINATVYGATPCTDRFGLANRAYNFNGNGQYMLTNNLGQSVQNKTLSCWVKLNTLQQAGGGAVGIETPGGSVFDAIVYNETGSGWLLGSDNFTRTTFTGYSESNLEWINLVYTYSPYDYKVYRNGILIHTDNQHNVYNFPTSSFLGIGIRHLGGGNAFINAQLDDIAIWDRSLSASEVSLLYNSSKTSSMSVQGGNTTQYLWNNGDSANLINVTPTQTTTYYCTVSNGISSCTDSVTVTVNPLPQNPISQDTIAACADSVIVTAAAGYSHYQWSTGDTTQNIFVKYTGMYTLSVTNANGCVGVDSVLVSIIDARIQQNDTTVCFGSDVFVSMHGLYTSESIPKTEEYVSNLYFDYDDFEGGSGSSDDWTQRDGTDPQIVSNTAFSGSHSLYFNNGWGRNFEFGVAENTQPIGGFFSAEYPYMSMAYKIPSSSHTSMLVYIAGIGWRGIAFTQGEQLSCYLRVASWNETDTVIKNNQWHFKTINLHEQLQQSLGPGNYKIEAVIFHEACSTYPVSGEMWIDKFMITKNKPSLYPVSYTWNTNDTASSISITPAQTTTYYCTVNNGISSCTDSVTVTVNPLPQNPIVQDTINACADSVIVTATAGYSHYQWSNGDTTQNIFAKYTGMYTLSVTNANGCVGVDSVLVSVINANVEQNDTSVCIGTTVSINIQNSANLLNNIKQGLVGYWPFNGNTLDRSGHMNNGIAYGATPTTDRFGNPASAYEFNGLNNSIVVPNSTSLNLTGNEMTMSYWLLFHNTENTPNSKGISKGGWDTQSGYESIFSNQGNGYLGSFIGYGGIADDSFNVHQGQWVYVTSVFTNGNIYIYLNGNLALSGNNGFNLILSPTSNPLYFGTRDPQNAWVGWLKGKMDDIGIWNRALNSVEVSQLYNHNAISLYLPDTHYLWSTGDTTSTINVSPTQTTTYYCTVSNGISSCTDSVTVTVNPLPTNFFTQDTLTICNTNTTLSAPANGSYSWSNGSTTQNITVNSIGWYACTYTNTNGCTGSDSVFVQFASPSSATNSATACNSYVWNTQTYTQSGTYTFTSLNAAGCTHTQTLVLTLNSSTSSNSSATAINSYTWLVAAQTYTQSGTYTYTSLNAAGCTYTQSLALAIQQATVLYTISNLVQTANNQFAFDVWATNTGNTALNVRSLSFGLNCSQGLGTLSFTYLSGSKDALFNSISTYTASSTLKGSGANSYYHLRLSTGNATSGNEPLLAANTPVKIGRFRVSASGNFSNATNPFLPPSGISALQLLTASGYTQCVLNARINSSSTVYSLYGTGNAATGTALNSLSAQMQPSPNSSNPFLLYSCLPTGTSNSVTACGSYTWTANGQTYTQSGTYTHTSLNISGCTHTDTLQLSIQVCETELHLGCLLEGYYDGNAGMMPVLQNQGEATTAGACDTIKVELHSDTAPYLIEASTHAVLQQNGTAICIFPIQSGSKYIVVKHRNAIETWSAQPINMGAVVNYDFRTAASQAYGSNQQDVSGNNSLYALYSGDINQDGNIDLYDLLLVNDDIENFIYGYYATDITGDGNVDLYDLLILENNITNFIYAIQP